MILWRPPSMDQQEKWCRWFFAFGFCIEASRRLLFVDQLHKAERCKRMTFVSFSRVKKAGRGIVSECDAYKKTALKLCCRSELAYQRTAVRDNDGGWVVDDDRLDSTWKIYRFWGCPYFGRRFCWAASASDFVRRRWTRQSLSWLTSWGQFYSDAPQLLFDNEVGDSPG